MTHLLLSSHPVNRSRVARIVRGLRNSGFTVSWNRELLGKPGWRQKLESQVEAAECVVAVWSQAYSTGGTDTQGVASGEVPLDLASRGKERGVLVAVRIDTSEPPLGFGDVPVLDLTGWRGRIRNRRFQHLVAQIRAVVAGEARPDLPARFRHRQLLARWMGAAGIGMTLIGFMADAFGFQALGCRVPGVHRLCGSLGLGGVPTEADRLYWEAREPGDCEALRRYPLVLPKGAFAEEAARRLLAAQTVVDESWTPEEYRLPLYVGYGNQPFPDESTAQADALARSQELAKDTCSGFSSGSFRLLSASPEVSTWRCRPRSGGTVCSFDGQTLCRVEVLKRTEREVCP